MHLSATTDDDPAGPTTAILPHCNVGVIRMYYLRFIHGQSELVADTQSEPGCAAIDGV
jgi:hypothetical protein